MTDATTKSVKLRPAGKTPKVESIIFVDQIVKYPMSKDKGLLRRCRRGALPAQLLVS